MLFIPVILSVYAGDTGLRVCIAIVACCIFIFALSIVAEANTSELFVTKATYDFIYYTYY